MVRRGTNKEETSKTQEPYGPLHSNFNTREFTSREIRHFWKQLFDMFGVSCGAFWTKIAGNQAEMFPNLPIYPRTVDSSKKTNKIAREHFWNNKKHKKELHDY